MAHCEQCGEDVPGITNPNWKCTGDDCPVPEIPAKATAATPAPPTAVLGGDLEDVASDRALVVPVAPGNTPKATPGTSSSNVRMMNLIPDVITQDELLNALIGQ